MNAVSLKENPKMMKETWELFNKKCSIVQDTPINTFRYDCILSHLHVPQEDQNEY